MPLLILEACVVIDRASLSLTLLMAILQQRVC